MPSPDQQRHAIHFFSPRGETMRREVRVIKLVLLAWLLAIVGSQLLVVLFESRFTSTLHGLTLFNLPVHYWLTGQFLPLWFVLLCIAFNIWVDRHTPQEHEGSLRFKLPSKD